MPARAAHRRVRADPSSRRPRGQSRRRLHEDAALSRAVGRPLGDVEERARDDDSVDRKRGTDPAQRNAALPLRRGARRARAAGRRRHRAAHVRRAAARSRVGRRPRPRPLRDRAVRSVRRQGASRCSASAAAASSSTSRSAARCTRTSARRFPTRSTIATSRSTSGTFHSLKFVPGTGLAKLYPNRTEAMINTIHHQAVNKLGRGMVVEAVAVPDGIVEAIRWRGPSYVLGVQWHPEFMFGPGIGEEHLDGSPILNEFLDAARVRKAQALMPNGRRHLSITNPATGAVILRVAADGPREVARALRVGARRRSRDGPQRRCASASPRSRSFASSIVARTETLAQHADAGGRQADPPVAQRAERPARRDSTSFSPNRRARFASRRSSSTRRRSSTSGSRTSRSA